MTHRRSRWSAATALAAAVCLMITACGNNSAAPAPANPPQSSAPPTVSAASSSSMPAAPSTEFSAPGTEAAGGSGQPSAPVNSEPAATAGATEACSLVTEQEAATALGADPGPGTQTALEGTATACTYLAGGSTLQFSLTLSDGRATYDEEHAHIPSAAASLISDMTGIGDSAFGQFQGSRGAINFDKGDALVVMGLNLVGAIDPPRDQLTVLATAAAGRI
jgi:uncharacterized Zn-binding protein involved in type VI secretion